jgi:hypothetical protein
VFPDYIEVRPREAPPMRSRKLELKMRTLICL